MFIDRALITVASGKGGAGCVAFRREKFVVQGGPEGGDGGRGGDLLFEVDNNTDTLSHFRGQRHYKAQNGQPGGSKNMTGKSGEDLTLKVPPGTQVFDADTDELLLDLTDPGEQVTLLKGGKGGLGNIHFKSSTNQRPTYAQPGLPGEERHLRLELKLIADVGLVGFPNVGKSTLISSVSHAKPQVADYEFTTLTPSLGVVQLDDYRSFVMADIPGIIDGAAEGRGLGLEFLRHIERTRVLLFVLDAVGYRPLDLQYDELRQELAKYSAELAGRNYAIVFSRVDADPAEAAERIDAFMKQHKIKPTGTTLLGETKLAAYEPETVKKGEPAFAVAISSVTGFNLKNLNFRLETLIQGAKKDAAGH